MPAAITEIRDHLISLIEETFPEVEWVGGVRAGKLYRALGDQGPYAGVSPLDAAPIDRTMAVQRPRVLVQLWGKFNKAVRLEDIADPTVIEEWAERLQNAIRESQGPVGKNWYLNVRRVDYPDDPVGQKTRVTLEVDADGLNPAIRETV